jgi:hypothetical protein
VYINLAVNTTDCPVMEGFSDEVRAVLVEENCASTISVSGAELAGE